MTDPIADLLTRIRNASRALLPEVVIPYSRLKESLVRLMQREGYLGGYKVEGNKIRTLRVALKYQGRKGVIEGLRRVSRPGLRRYVGVDEIPVVLGGMGVSVLSTPRGVLTGAEARKLKVGGEVLCCIW